MGHQVHLTLHEREGIMLMRRDGRGVCEISRAIGRSKSTVSRELKRNSCERFHRASTAQRCYAERRKACRRRRVLDDEHVFSLVRDKFLKEQWSPEQIEGRLALELGGSPVSDTTIYRGISGVSSTAASAGARRREGCAIAASAAAARRSGVAKSRCRTRFRSGRRPPTSAASPGIGRATRLPAKPEAPAC